jgi:hypothetical protein
VNCFSYVLYYMAEYVLCKTGLGAFDAKALRGGRIAPLLFMNWVCETLVAGAKQLYVRCVCLCVCIFECMYV